MPVLKFIGKLLLFGALYFGMFLLYLLLLIVYAWLDDAPFFSWLFNWLNNIGFAGGFVFLFQAFRCALINEVLLYAAKRLSGYLPLFVFAVFLVLCSAVCLTLPGTIMNGIIIIIELVFAGILAFKSFKLLRCPADEE